MLDAAAIIAALLPKAEGDPRAMLHVAELLRRDGRAAEALAVAARAQALAPHDREVSLEAAILAAKVVPKWHFPMLRDSRRLTAYDAALRRAVRPGMRVLEIGTGTGILAMMAVRAGAGEVVTCEMNPAMAQVARQTLARNGYGDRVRVIAKRSDALDADADLGGPMDLLVSEIVSDSLLSENVLPAHADAVRRLLKPGAPVIPARGAVRVALAEDTRFESVRIGTVDGFDLSAMESMRDPVSRLPAGSKTLTLRSAPQDLFTFDLAAAAAPAGGHVRIACTSLSGRVNGVVQWIALTLDDATQHENAPGSTPSHWGLRFVAMREAVDTAVGDVLTVQGRHSRDRVLMWVDEPG